VNLVSLAEKVYTLLEKNGPMTREELCEELQQPRTNLYRVLTELMENGLITEFTEKTNTGYGRANTFFTLRQP
jgi:predicted transcriptional regulator